MIPSFDPNLNDTFGVPKTQLGDRGPGSLALGSRQVSIGSIETTVAGKVVQKEEEVTLTRFATFGLPEYNPAELLERTAGFGRDSVQLPDPNKRFSNGRGFGLPLDLIERISVPSHTPSGREIISFGDKKTNPIGNEFTPGTMLPEKGGSDRPGNPFQNGLPIVKEELEVTWGEKNQSRAVTSSPKPCSPLDLAIRRPSEPEKDQGALASLPLPLSTWTLGEEDALPTENLVDCRSRHEIKLNETTSVSKIRDHLEGWRYLNIVEVLSKMSMRVSEMSHQIQAPLEPNIRLKQKLEQLARAYRAQSSRLRTLEGDLKAQRLVELSLRDQVAALRTHVDSPKASLIPTTHFHLVRNPGEVLAGSQRSVNELRIELESTRQENSKFVKKIEHFEVQIQKHESEVEKVVAQLEKMAAQNQMAMAESKQMLAFKDAEIGRLSARLQETLGQLKAKDDKIMGLELLLARRGSGSELVVGLGDLVESRPGIMDTQSQKVIPSRDEGVRGSRGLANVGRLNKVSGRTSTNPEGLNGSVSSQRRSSLGEAELKMTIDRLKSRVEEQIDQIASLNGQLADQRRLTDTFSRDKTALEIKLSQFQKELEFLSWNELRLSPLDLGIDHGNFDKTAAVHLFNNLKDAFQKNNFIHQNESAKRNPKKRSRFITSLTILGQPKYTQPPAAASPTVRVTTSLQILTHFKRFLPASANDLDRPGTPKMPSVQVFSSSAFKRTSLKHEPDVFPEAFSPIHSPQNWGQYDTVGVEAHNSIEIPETEDYKAKYHEQMDLYTQLSEKYFPLQSNFIETTEKLEKYKRKCILLKNRYEKAVEDLKKLRQFKYDVENGLNAGANNASNPFLRKSIIKPSDDQPSEVDSLRYEIEKLRQECASAEQEHRAYKRRIENNRSLLLRELAELYGIKEQFQTNFAKIK